MKTLYTASATANGREGRAISGDGLIDVGLAPPREVGGSGEGTNPEALFAAGYAACFASAAGVVARRLKLDAEGVSVAAEVDLNTSEDRAFGLGVRLRVSLPALDPAEARRVAEAAHEVCPYSRATRGNIEVSVTVEPGNAS